MPADDQAPSSTSDSDESASEGQQLDWSSKNHEVVYEQGQRVLEAQKDDINQIDDKALRTVRITALVIGVGVTGLQATERIRLNEETAAVGLFLLFLALSFGVVTYNESSEILGPTAEYLDSTRGGRNGVDWETDLLVQFPGWVSRNQQKVERSALLFSLCQFSLILGVGFGAAALLQLGIGVTVAVLVVVLVILVVAYRGASRHVARDHPND